jgi:transposase
MLIRQAFRYELAPTLTQQGVLANHAGAARWAWNWGLSVRCKAFKRRGQTLTAMDLHRLLVRLKRTTRYGWLYEVSKCAPQEALRDLDRAYANYWQGRKQGRRVGFPRFKKRGRCAERFRLAGAIRVEDGAVVLPRIGRVATKEPTGKFCGRILSATCRREADRWYCSLTVEAERPDRPRWTVRWSELTGASRGSRPAPTAPRSTVPGRWSAACGYCGDEPARSAASRRAPATMQRRSWRWRAATGGSATSASTRCTRPPRRWRKPSR